MSKHLNLILAVVILAISALLARGFFQPKPSLQADLKASLDSFWADRRNEVEVTAAQDVRLRVYYPLNTSAGKQQWVFPFCRFVAQRHPGARIASLVVTDATGERPVPELGPVSGSLANDENAAAAHRELLARKIQLELNKLLGPGRALALADVTVMRSVSQWLPNVPRDYRVSGQKYGRRAAVEQSSEAAPSSALRIQPPEGSKEERAEVCLVFNGDPGPENLRKAEEAAKAVNGAELPVRKFILP